MLHTGHVLSAVDTAAVDRKLDVTGPSLVTREMHSSTWREKASDDAASNGIGVWQIGHAVVISNPVGRLSSSAWVAAAAASSGSAGRASGRAGAVCDAGRTAGVSMPGRAGGGGDRRERRSHGVGGGGRCLERESTGTTERDDGDSIAWVCTAMDVTVEFGGMTTLSRRLAETFTSCFTCSAAASEVVTPAVEGVITVKYKKKTVIGNDEVKDANKLISSFWRHNEDATSQAHAKLEKLPLTERVGLILATTLQQFLWCTKAQNCRFSATSLTLLVTDFTSDFRPPKTSADICVVHDDLGWKKRTTVIIGFRELAAID